MEVEMDEAHQLYIYFEFFELLALIVRLMIMWMHSMKSLVDVVQEKLDTNR